MTDPFDSRQKAFVRLYGDIVQELREAYHHQYTYEGVRVPDIAAKLGMGITEVIEIFDGGVAIDLKTIADMTDALNHRLEVKCVPLRKYDAKDEYESWLTPEKDFSTCISMSVGAIGYGSKRAKKWRTLLNVDRWERIKALAAETVFEFHVEMHDIKELIRQLTFPVSSQVYLYHKDKGYAEENIITYTYTRFVFEIQDDMNEPYVIVKFFNEEE